MLAFVALGVDLAGAVYADRMPADTQLVAMGQGFRPALPSRRSFSAATSNIGYAEQGAVSDFTADGGEHLFPPSRADVNAGI